MLSNLTVVRPGHFGGLVGQQLDGFVPLPGQDGGLNCLLDLLCLDVVVDGGLGLLNGHEVVAPSLLQTGDQPGLCIFGQVHCLFVGISFDIAIKSFLEHVHLFIELACLFVHAACCQAGGYLLEEVGWEADVGVVYNVGCSGGDASLKVEVDCGVVVSLLLLYLSCLFLLPGLQQPVVVIFLELLHIGVLVLLSTLDGLVPFVQFLVHLHSFLDLVVLQKQRLGPMELFLKDCQFGLHLVVVDAVLSACLLLVVFQNGDHLLEVA